MKVLLVNPGEYPEVKEIEPGLQSMQELVGGLIQAVYPFEDPVALICNEEGKLNGMKLNRALREPETGQVYDIVAGPFFMCGLGEEDFTSLTEEQIQKYEEVFHYPEVFISAH